MSPTQNAISDPVLISFPDGVQLWTFIRDRVHFVVCDQCGQEIKLTSGGVPTCIFQHRGAKTCLLNRKLKRYSPLTGHSRQTSVSVIASGLASLSTSSEHPSASLNHIPIPSTSSASVQLVTGPCPGVLVAWKSGSIWDTYCYQIHAMHNVGWEPISFKTDTNELRLRAEKCSLNTEGGRSCFACLSIETSRMYRDFVERAFNVKDHTPWKYLNPQQHTSLAIKLTKEIKRLRVQVCTKLLLFV